MIYLNESLIEQAKKFTNREQDYLLDDTMVIFHKLKATDDIIDYSFLVSPVVKSYEGFLKDFFLHIGLIDETQHQGDRFRVGKALNPSLRYKNFSIFQRLSDMDDSGTELAELLWDAWKKGRNESLHFFAGNNKKLTLSEAIDRIHQVLAAIIKAGEFLATQEIKYR